MGLMKRDIVIFKGNRDGLTIYCDDKAPWEEVATSLATRLSGRGGAFFASSSVVLDVGRRVLSPEQVGFLWQVIQENGLFIKSIKADADSEKKADLFSINSERGLSESDNVTRLPTLIVRRNVRSGQNITFAGNVLIFGDVNPGAEITASGFVMVVGDLRGTVHAGAEGDEKSWVAALHLQPVQLRIAGLITRAPEEEPQEPEVAQICDGVIMVRQFNKISNHFDVIGGIDRWEK